MLKAGAEMGVPLLVLVVVLTFAYLLYALLRPEKF
jgi:K+-transporting ATPase KdpF subunit